jgi:hypothetical protein
VGGGRGGDSGGVWVNVEMQISDSLEGGGESGTRMRRGDGLPGIVVIW